MALVDMLESKEGWKPWTIKLISSQVFLTEARCTALMLLAVLIKFIAANKMLFWNSFNIGPSSSLQYLQAIHEAGQDVVGSKSGGIRTFIEY